MSAAVHQGRRPGATVTLGGVVMGALLLAGCGDRADSGAATSIPSPVASSAAKSGGKAEGGGKAGSGVEIDPQAATSVEDSVAEAGALLQQLEQEFEQDDVESR